MLLLNGQWVLADYSLARDTSVGTDTRTMAGHGSAAYMAPELWWGEPATIRTDLYAVGCLAYEVATGRPPFTGTAVDREHRHATAPDLPANFQGRYQRLVRRLLAKTPEGRPSSAALAIEWLASSPEADEVNNVLDAIAARRDRSGLAARDRRRATESAEAAMRDARAALRDIADEAVTVLRRIDDTAKVQPTPAERAA